MITPPLSSTLFPYTTLFRSPSVLILDFVGNSGKHKLVSTADVLGGKYSDEAKALALKKAEKADKPVRMQELLQEDRKSTRLNSSHVSISYAVFCLKKKNYKK